MLHFLQTYIFIDLLCGQSLSFTGDNKYLNQGQQWHLSSDMAFPEKSWAARQNEVFSSVSHSSSQVKYTGSDLTDISDEVQRIRLHTTM